MKTVLLHIVLLLGCVATQAQSVQQVELEIQAHLKHIQYWRFEYSPEDTSFKTKVSPEDSLVNANTMLVSYLMKVCSKQPELLRYNFKFPENSDMRIATSDDGKMRIYSWDANTGENEHDYYTVCQYLTANGVKAVFDMEFRKKSEPQKPTGNNFQKIIVVNASNITYYLAVSSDITTDNNVVKQILALGVSGNELLDRVIFSTNGQSASSIKYTYNYSSNYDFRKMKEEYDIRLEKNKLYIPEVADYKMTGKYVIYNFDGEKFVLGK
jgi:outer membrane lipoprotein-sorting protein